MQKSFHPNQKLILVSNREPYIHENKKNTTVVKRAIGGLVTAMDPIMQQNGGTWIAWGSGSDDFTTVSQDMKIDVPPKNPTYTLKRIQISDKEENLFYKGYSNSVLWPLFHIFLEKIEISEESWNMYKTINKRFATAIIEEIDKDSFVWIHDYHLSLVPKYVRDMVPTAHISLFWHIPWPPWEIYGTLPQREEILTGLLNTDLIGFHTKSYVRNFISCCNHKAKTSVNKTMVTFQDHFTKAVSIPLGITYESYAYNMVTNNEIEKEKSNLKKAHNVDSIVLGIDRLDYTKGILNRLKAYEYFLDTYPAFHKKVVLIQIATPSRYEIKEYFNMKKNIDETVGRINAKFRTADWTPVKYFFRRIPQNLLLAYYQVSDIALLTPIRDGMNLIAKEFIAARNKPAVLILSEFAGASEELNEAIIVNPYDIPSTADALKTAIIMPAVEKKNRFDLLKKKVKKHDATWWLEKFFSEWKHCYDQS